MHKDHPNVSIIASRKRRTQIILRCTYKGERWEVPAGRDPKAARRKAIAISQDIEQVKMGIKQLNDVRADSKATTPVKLLLDEWEAHLKASGVTAYHIATQIQRATDLLAAGGIERIGPKSGAKVRDALVRMRDADASAQTIKHYKQAIGQFERWLVTAQHMPHAVIAPRLADLKTNVAADRRHRRPHDGDLLVERERRRLAERAAAHDAGAAAVDHPAAMRRERFVVDREIGPQVGRDGGNDTGPIHGKEGQWFGRERAPQAKRSGLVRERSTLGFLPAMISVTTWPVIGASVTPSIAWPHAATRLRARPKRPM